MRLEWLGPDARRAACCAGGTVGVIAMKLGMYMLCRKSSDASVQAFALDHINDVVVNSVGLAGPFPPHCCFNALEDPCRIAECP